MEAAAHIANLSRSVPKWVETAKLNVGATADPAWFEDASLWEPVPSQPFTFTVPAGKDKYVFRYHDGSPDVDNGGNDACAGAWDQQYGSNRDNSWVGRQHFDFIVTRQDHDGTIAIEARLASTPLELATTLLQAQLQIEDLNL